MANTGIQSRESPRIVYRTNNVTFRVDFFYDAAKLVPVTPQDPVNFPAYNIINPSGIVVQTGVGTPDGGPGYYKADWTVLADAELSVANNRWRMEWIMIDPNNRQIPFVHEFDVADRTVSTIDTHEIEFIALEQKPYTVRIPLTTVPTSLGCVVSESNDANSIVSQGTLAGGQIIQIVNGDSYVYFMEILSGRLKGGMKYTVVWTIQDTIGTVEDHVFQVIRVLPHMLLQYIADLRVLIDRIQKRLHWVQAYQDSHLVNFLMHGLDLVNNHSPFTAWSYTTVPGPVISYWILYSGWYALQSQYLVNAELDFNYSGQEVTLDMDVASKLDTAIGRMMDYLNGSAGTGGLTNTKTSIVRMQRGVGAYGGRPVRFTSINNLVFKLVSYSSTDFMGILTQFGLI
jgi:hypothetical protein